MITTCPAVTGVDRFLLEKLINGIESLSLLEPEAQVYFT